MYVNAGIIWALAQSCASLVNNFFTPVCRLNAKYEYLFCLVIAESDFKSFVYFSKLYMCAYFTDFLA